MTISLPFPLLFSSLLFSSALFDSPSEPAQRIPDLQPSYDGPPVPEEEEHDKGEAEVEDGVEVWF
jgi:hypothetical protein